MDAIEEEREGPSELIKSLGDPADKARRAGGVDAVSAGLLRLRQDVEPHHARANFHRVEPAPDAAAAGHVFAC